MANDYRYVGKGFLDRHGKRRYRFRRTGYDSHYMSEPFGTKAFEREYAACMSAEPQPVAGRPIRNGSVSDVIRRYYADVEFHNLRPSTQKVYRGVLERFRASFGDDPIGRFDAQEIARFMHDMRDVPSAAARLRKLLARLMSIARRDKLVHPGFDPVKDTRPPRNDSKGYHSWTEAELEAFETKHPIGTKPRLAFALLLYGAQRSGDVRLMTRAIVASGRIQLEQGKTSNAVDVPIVDPLRRALDAGPLGVSHLLEAKGGVPFTEKGFYGMMKKACTKAGLPRCSPHGLRKAAARRCREAGCTDDEGMAITGHKTVKEYRRYAGESAIGTRADTAMSKVMANHSETLAKRNAQGAENNA